MPLESVTERRVPTRRMSFEEAIASIPHHFADGDVVISHFAAVMSGLFPEGEDYFVRSVRHFRDRIEDPTLKREVAGFIGQEAMHGREHRALNERLAELGYPTLSIDARVGRLLRFRERHVSPLHNLAFTAACEHFTATLAALVLTNEAVREANGDSAVARLLLWHALEEAEHKAVAFDVYRAMGGSERMRIWTMKFLRKAFTCGVVADLAVSIARDRDGRRLRTLVPSIRRATRSPWISKQVREELREYDRKGFHPDDIDMTALVDEWRERLFGEGGELTEHLVGRTA
jgi:predicted metal-dependent hydrolase